jgi:hypothetical protein
MINALRRRRKTKLMSVDRVLIGIVSSMSSLQMIFNRNTYFSQI